MSGRSPVGRAAPFLLFAAFALHAQEPRTDSAPTSREAPESRPGDFSSEAMTRRVAELLPLIEEESGMKAGGPIEVRSASRSELGAVILEDTIMLREGFKGSARGAFLRNILLDQTSALGRLALAKVDLGSGVVFVVPENFSALAEHDDVGPAFESQASLDSILVHEAIHVLHHRRAALAGFFDAPRSLEELLLANTVVEGFAEYATRRVMRRLGLEDAMELRRRAQGTFDPETVKNSTPRDLANLRALGVSAYVEGERFVEAVAAKLGRDAAFERLMAAPPKSRQEISDVATYLNDGAIVIDELAISEAVLACVPKPRWETAPIGLPNDVMRADLGDVDGAKADAALASVVGAVWVGGKESMRALDPLNELSIRILIAADAAGAARLFDVYVDAMHAADAALKESEAELVVENIETKDATLAGAEAALVSVRTLKPPRRKAVVGTRTLARAQNAFVQIDVSSSSMTTEQRETLVSDVLRIAVEPPTRGAASRRAERPPAPTTRVKGRLKWKGAEGGPETFTVRVWTGSPDRRILVANGSGGVFEMDVPDVATARVGSIFIEGERRNDAVGAKFETDEGATTELSLKWIERDVVRVRDPSGAPIPDAVAYERAKYETGADKDDPYLDRKEFTWSAPCSANAEGLIRKRRAAEKSLRVWIVHAPGRRAVVVDSEARGDAANPIEVVLPPGGDVEFELADRDRYGVAYITFTGDGDPDELPVDDGERSAFVGGARSSVRWEGLAPGRYAASLRLGDDGAKPVDAANFVVVAGEKTKVRFRPTDLDSRRNVTLRIKPPTVGWTNKSRRIDVEDEAHRDVAMSEMRFRASRPHEETTLKALLPGVYRLSIFKPDQYRESDALYKTTFETTADGPDVIEIEIPTFRELTIRARDDETSDAIENITLMVRDDNAPGRYSSVETTSDGGVHKASISSKATSVRVVSVGFEEREIAFEAGEAPVELAADLKAGGTIEVVVNSHDGERFGCRVVAERVFLSPFASLSKSTTLTTKKWVQRTTFDGLESGKWRIHATSEDGATVSETVEVEVDRRKTVRVDLRLQPK